MSSRFTLLSEVQIYVSHVRQMETARITASIEMSLQNMKTIIIGVFYTKTYIKYKIVGTDGDGAYGGSCCHIYQTCSLSSVLSGIPEQTHFCESRFLQTQCSARS